MPISNAIQFLLLAALWGGAFLFMRIASPALGPIWLTEARVLLAGLFLLPILLRLDLLRELRRNLIPLFIIGCVNSAIPFSLFAFASLFLPAGFSAILNSTVPLFGAAIAWLWLKEKLTIGRIIGFGLGFAGVVILVGWKTVIPTQSFVMAVAAGLMAASMYGFSAPYAKHKLVNVPPLVIATGSLLSAAIFLLPVIPFTVPKTPPTITVILAVLALALFSTTLAYIIYFQLIQKVGSTKALTVAYLIPFFAMLWGAIVLQEPITRSMLLGCGLILFGTAIANDLLAIRTNFFRE